ncbi:MAG: carboxymuconolactone decarboxylase family protein [Rhodospirillaceae bacterium]|nr:carboxymuconolactone decarboxylase family protein [Rhodospirillaceae bacterium]
MPTNSEPRIHPPDPSELDAAQRRVYDEIVAGPRGEVVGPLGVWLRRPELADRAQRLGEYARYGTSLPPVLSELAILVVARTWGSEFEWLVHKPIALAAGVPPDAVEAIRSGGTPLLGDPVQSAVYAFCAALLSENHVDDTLYASAVGALGENGVVDLVGILGYYSLISMTINAFRVPPPEGVEPELAAGRQASTEPYPS